MFYSPTQGTGSGGHNLTLPSGRIVQVSNATLPASNNGEGGGGGAAAPAPSNPALDQYNQQIGNTQSALNRLGAQQDQGYAGIDASYNGTLAQLLQGYNQSKQTSDQNILSSKQDFVGGKNTVRSNAGASLSGLLRLLGSRGAGGGSAATITAPGAVARQATLQQGDLTNTFGHNQQELNQAWGTYQQGYNDNVAGAGTQRNNARSKLESDVANNRASLLQSLAQLQGQRAVATGANGVAAAQPYYNQANAVLDQASRYNIAPIQVTTNPYTAPSLDKYTVNPNAAPTVQGQAQSNDYTSPYLAALLGKRQQAVIGG